MANGLTGDFDAVALVRVKTVNTILASVHQNGAHDEVSPSIPHSFALRVGDPTKLSVLLAKFIDWNSSSIFGSFGSGGGGQPGGSSKKQPPGASRAKDDLWKEINDLQDAMTTPGTVRGLAQVQLGAPKLSFSGGVGSSVTAHYPVRANYIPDPDTLSLPDPIHGEVRITFAIGTKLVEGKTVVEASIDSDNDIEFHPASGTLSSEDAGKITTQVRKVVKSGFEPTTVEVPDDIPFDNFKPLGSGSNQVVALPVTLGGEAPAASALGSVNNLFLSSGDEYGVAVRREHVESEMQSFKDTINGFSVSYEIGWWVFTVTYNVSISSVSLTWQTGSIKVTVQGSAVTGSILPNYNFTITETITASLDAATQTVSLQAGGLSVSGLPSAAIGTVKSAVQAQQGPALAQAETAMKEALIDGVSMQDIVKSFDNGATARYSSLDIVPDGIVLHGDITAGGRSDVFVEFTPRANDDGYTALQSWVPAGATDRFEWSWTEGHAWIPWEAETKVHADEHRFVLLEKDVPTGKKLCLRVVGTQVHETGFEQAVDGGETCSVNGKEFVWAMPSWWETIMAPIWLPDPPPELILDEAITAHVNVLAHSKRAGSSGPNVLFHFAAPGSAPLEGLGEAFAGVGEDTHVAMYLVMPAGSFGESRSAVERGLGSPGRGFTASLEITEDYGGAWSRAFGVETAPATFLMNAHGEFVWDKAGALDTDALARALKEHAITGPPPTSSPLRLTVTPGRRALDFLIEPIGDQPIALRRLRGRSVLLSFWKGFSAPCLAQLRQLQALHDRADEDAPVILAVGDGEDPEQVTRFAREHELTLRLVPDPDRSISGRYGVNCWPTTVTIGAAGLVQRVEFGLSHARNDDGSGGQQAP